MENSTTTKLSYYKENLNKLPTYYVDENSNEEIKKFLIEKSRKTKFIMIDGKKHLLLMSEGFKKLRDDFVKEKSKKYHYEYFKNHQAKIRENFKKWTINNKYGGLDKYKEKIGEKINKLEENLTMKKEKILNKIKETEKIVNE